MSSFSLLTPTTSATDKSIRFGICPGTGKGRAGFKANKQPKNNYVSALQGVGSKLGGSAEVFDPKHLAILLKKKETKKTLDLLNLEKSKWQTLEEGRQRVRVVQKHHVL